MFSVDLHCLYCRIYNDIFTTHEGKNQLPLIGFSQALCKQRLPNRERAQRSSVLAEITRSRLNLRGNRKMRTLEKKLKISIPLFFIDI